MPRLPKPKGPVYTAENTKGWNMIILFNGIQVSGVYDANPEEGWLRQVGPHGLTPFLYGKVIVQIFGSIS